MDKMIVTVFNDERSAYEGATALRELHEEGSLTLYASTVIFKDANGVITVKQAADEGPFGTFAGLATGSLIGLLGGPVGVAVGAAAGTLTGSLFDVVRLGISDDFLTEVYVNLVPNKWAVVAEVDETWVTPLDTGHVLAPELHRLTNDEMIDSGMRWLCGDGESKRFGADDEQIGLPVCHI